MLGRAGVDALNGAGGATTRLDEGMASKSSEALKGHRVCLVGLRGRPATHHFEAKVRPRSAQSLVAARSEETTEASTVENSDMR